MAETRYSKRSERFWTRLTQWYGARLTSQYGEEIPPDISSLVDDADNDCVKAVLSALRAKHVTHPPTFPEIDQLFRQGRKSASPKVPGNAQKIADWVLRNRHLTPNQLRGPWNFFGSEDGSQVEGVVIPADGAAKGYRVTLEDMAFDRTEEPAKPRPAINVSQLIRGDWAAESPFPKEFR